jgi:cytosine/adenosine deaminase-related metal-dependent hydrolase
MTGALLLRDAALADGCHADLLLAGGRIESIGAAPPAAAARIIDLAGRLVVPGFVDGHIHLDKTLLGAPWVPHQAGDSVADRIAAEKRLRGSIAVPLERRARRLVAQVAALGTTAMRTHVDIDSGIGLRGLHAVLAVRDACRALADIQIVAFPQSGVLADPGTADLLGQALAEGADLVGGLDPASIDGDIEGQLAVVFGLADRRGVAVDIHLHDPGTLGAFQLRRIAARSRSLGMQGRVAVSHAYALGQIDDATFGHTAAALAEGGVAIMTTGPGAVAMPPVKRLRAEGVVVFAGSDNIRDAWSPFGTGDMLQRAMLIGTRAGFASDADLHLALDLVTAAPAAVLGLQAYGVRPGAAADLVVLDAAAVPEAVAGGARRHLVVRGGAVGGGNV